jgi:hypothetical protein
VPALHGAVALAEVDDVAVLVAEYLELDVARPREIFLHVHVAAAEGGERFGARQLERAGEVVGIPGDAHPLPAAAGGGLDDHRKADVPRERERLVRRPRSGRAYRE